MVVETRRRDPISASSDVISGAGTASDRPPKAAEGLAEGLDTRQKAALRGVSHNFAAVGAAVAGILLTVDAPSYTARWSCAVYAIALTAMFTISASYHRLQW